MKNQNNSLNYRVNYYKVGKNLVLSDLLIFKQNFIDKFIDVSIWIILTIFVTSYIMPYFGLQNNFGVFQFAGILAAVGLFELYSSVVDFVSDLQGDRHVDYALTLPIPSWFAIASKSIYFFIIYLLLAVVVFPIGKLCLWNQLDLTQINYFYLILTLIMQNIFYACFAIWAVSMIDNMSNLGKVWSRFIFPMWFMGGFQFSWMSLYQVNKGIAIINLLNPMIYVTESTRIAFLGQQDYLNFWLCLGALIIFSILAFWIGFMNLKNRLDFVS